MSEQIIGIDFGTSNSVMAWFNPETGKPQVIFNSEGEDKTPSIVYYAPEGVIVGRGAQAALTDAEYFDETERCRVLQSVFCSVKRDLGRRMLHALPDGRQVSPVEITSEIFKKLKKDAEELFFHAPLKKAVVTYPAAFSPTQKSAIEEAARLAGFEKVALLEEPVAAALGQLSQGVDIGQGLIVYDLGGGTFDLAYVQRKNESGFHSPLPSLGLPRCGGDDIDQQIYDLLDEAARSGGLSLYHVDGSLSRFALQECRKGKESLSSLTRSGITIMIPEAHPDSKRYFVKREELESLMSPIVENTVKQTLEMVRRAQQAKLPLGQVVLIGGSTRSPIIPEQLQKALPQGITLSKTMFADNAVALGAAVQIHQNHLGGENKTAQPEKIHPVKVKPTTEIKPVKTNNDQTTQIGGRGWVVDKKGQGDFKTISEAVKAANSNDKIIVLSGTYFEHVIINQSIEISGDGNLGEVILEWKGSEFGVYFSAVSGKLSNFVIHNGVEIASGALVLENCDISNPSDSCVFVRNGSDPTIRNNRIHNGKKHGISIKNHSLGLITNNDIYENRNYGIGVYEGSNPVIRKNRIYESKNDGVLICEGSKGIIEENDIFNNREEGIRIMEESNPIIRKNRIHNGKADGIYVVKNGLGEIYENEIYSNKQDGIQVTAGGNPTVSKNIIRDNNDHGISVLLLGKGTYCENVFSGNKEGTWDIYPACYLFVRRSGNIEK